VDSLGVYDALVNLWQHSINKSGFVIPARDVEKVSLHFVCVYLCGVCVW